MGDQVLQATKRTGQSQPSAPWVRLTCEACRQRKVKCDKLSPCTSCQRLGLVCVPVERARLPRGRAQKTAERALGSDKELSDRVTKLEQLLQKFASERGNDSPQAPTVADQRCNIVEQVSDAEAKKADVGTWRDQVALSNLNLPRGPRRSTTYVGSSFWEDIMQQLCDIYLKNVDPLFKVLHRPSLRAFLWDGKPYLDYEPDHQAPATLASAVYLTAVCSLEEAECQILFNTEKAAVVAEFQKETEGALARADFVTTNDITVLQAYVLSLLAARSQDQSRRVWTMLSMALRVGQALSLHIADPPFAVCPFEQEMRRRVWLGIGLLDVAASLDRASEPMMQSAWLDSHPPLNINDEEIWLGMQGPIREHSGGTFTDMTHTLVTAASSSVTRSLAFADFIETAVKLMGLRQQVVLDFQRTASNLLSGCRPDLSDFQWYAQRTAGVISSWLQLACLRPLQRSKNFIPPKVHGDVLLKLAAENLQWSQEAYNYPGAAP